MANNYYDATGVLVLDKVTPVITALFGGFNLDASYPGDGEVYVAKISEDNDPNWDDIRESLVELAKELGLTPSENVDDAAAGWLHALTAHFGDGEDEVLCNIVEPDDSADLADIYRIALRLDDGHGLKAIKIEGCWHCDKPRLFEFGGNGEYIGRNCYVSSVSSSSVLLGGKLDAALASGNLDDGAKELLASVSGILNGVYDKGEREALKQRLATLLATAEASGEPKLKWFAVTGRLPGDDEDTLYVFNVATREDAIKAFEQAMYDNEVNPEETRESVFKEHGQYVFVNSIVSSDTPIADIG